MEKPGCKARNFSWSNSDQLLLYKFFDLSTPSMRKCCDGEKKMKRKVKIAVHYPRASRPPERRLTGTLTPRAD